jgi:magnesium transporter
MVGLLNGLMWASMVALAVVFWFGDWRIGLVIAVALVINLVVAAISGVGLPLLLRRLGIDPALAGSVMLTTLTDVIGFATFLGLGALLLT